MAKRGRPPLSDEEKDMRKEKQIDKPKKKRKPAFNSSKEGGYITQKKYRATHKNINYEPKVRIPLECRSSFDKLLADTGLSTTRLFINAVEEKYGVVLHIDKKK